MTMERLLPSRANRHGGYLPHLSRPHPGLAARQKTAGQRIRLYTGEVVACAEPTILETLLGSCVAVCLRDPIAGVGGMNHILLPGGGDDGIASRFGVHAMELLINELMRQGGDRRRLVAKAFGAANVIGGQRRPTIGDLNAAFVSDFLAREGIALVASRLGGNQAVRVDFATHTGKAIVYTVDGSRLPVILDSEWKYRASHSADKDCSGEVSLF